MLWQELLLDFKVHFMLMFITYMHVDYNIFVRNNYRLLASSPGALSLSLSLSLSLPPSFHVFLLYMQDPKIDYWTFFRHAMLFAIVFVCWYFAVSHVLLSSVIILLQFCHVIMKVGELFIAVSLKQGCMLASFPGSSQFFNVTRRKTGEPGI